MIRPNAVATRRLCDQLGARTVSQLERRLLPELKAYYWNIDYAAQVFGVSKSTINRIIAGSPRLARARALSKVT